MRILEMSLLKVLVKYYRLDRNHFGNSDISNCEAPAEKVPEILYFHLKGAL